MRHHRPARCSILIEIFFVLVWLNPEMQAHGYGEPTIFDTLSQSFSFPPYNTLPVGGNYLQTHLKRLGDGKGRFSLPVLLWQLGAGLGFLVPHPDVSFRDKETQRLQSVWVCS